MVKNNELSLKMKIYWFNLSNLFRKQNETKLTNNIKLFIINILILE